MSDMEFAQKLLELGIPVVVCTPRPGWKPGDARSDLLPATGWAVITAAECDLSTFRPGIDALAGVGGHGIDVPDVDTKDGGTVENLPPFRWFAHIRTPSGGAHYYVRSTGIGKISPLTTSAGHVGDFAGGTKDGGSRMLFFLPGSTRPKYPGKAYEVVSALDESIVEHEPDDDLIGALLACGGSREGAPGKPAARWGEVRAFLAEHSEIPEQQCHYGRAAVDGLIADANNVVPGDLKRGRHAWATGVATRVVELVRAGCATAADVDRLEEELHRIKPEGGTDWGACLAWGLTNADGAVKCGIHGEVGEYVASLESLAGSEVVHDGEQLANAVGQFEVTEPEPPQDAAVAPYAFTPGGSFILDTPADPEPLWGAGSDVLLAEGESLVFAGPQGVGKTTLGQQLGLGRAGFGEYGELLGYPVKPGQQRTLYLAMDRPRQAARSMRRMVGEVWRAELDERISVWQGPPPADLAKFEGLLLDLARKADADTVVIDSIKDAAVGLIDDEVGARYNRARQTAIAGGVQLIELHHNRKVNGVKGRPSVEDLYGSVWLSSGAGSVLLLVGAPGDPIVSMHHVKQPAAEVGPLKLVHDHDVGHTSVWHATDLVQMAKAAKSGLSAVDVARVLFETDKPTAGEKEKARRKLDKLVRDGLLGVAQEGDPASNRPAKWGPA